MTVINENVTAGPYSGNDIVDEFGFDFQIWNTGEVSVYETDDEGVETLLVLDTDYTVVFTDTDGLITRVAGPLPTGYEWFIRSNYPELQGTSFTSQGAFFPKLHETAFDKLTKMVQQIGYRVSNAAAVLNMFGHKIINLGDGTEDGDAVNYGQMLGAESNVAQSAQTAVDAAIVSVDAKDSFIDQYWGAYETEPTESPIGNPPTAGDLYFNTDLGVMKVYDENLNGWKNTSSSVGGIRNEYAYTGSKGDTTFLAIYDPGFVDVIVNGSTLMPDDYTATDGTQVVLNEVLEADGDTVNIKAYNYVEFSNGGSIEVVAKGTTQSRNLAEWTSLETLTYDNVADAKADIKLEVGQSTKVLGHYTPNDGGAAEYIVVAGGTGVDDGGSYHDMANGNQLELIVTQPYIDIGVFGAYENGVDDGPQIVKALDYAFANSLITRGSRPVVMTRFREGNEFQVFEQTAGFSTTAGKGFTKVLERKIQTNNRVSNQYESNGQDEDFNTIGNYHDIVNNGTGGYGNRIGYHQTEDVTGFSIGTAVVAKNDGAGQALSTWNVQSSPVGATPGGTFIKEGNPINVSQDSGYAKRRGKLTTWSGGVQIVPESKDLARAGSTNTFNTTYGFAVVHSSGLNSSGLHVQTYNGFLIERGAIAEGGVGVQVAGTDVSDGPDENPGVPSVGVRIEQDWIVGLDMTEGRFQDDAAINLKEGHKITIGGALHTSITGTPEGNLVAMVGSTCTRLDGGVGSTFYVKESGTGNTGWVAK